MELRAKQIILLRRETIQQPWDVQYHADASVQAYICPSETRMCAFSRKQIHMRSVVLHETVV